MQDGTQAAAATRPESAGADLGLAHEKLGALRTRLLELGSVAVAFSGGVDSTFLLKVAHDTLGDAAIAVTARSESFPERELAEARAFCAAEGIRHLVVESDELDIPGFDHNPTNRCYLCKREFFTRLGEGAATLGVAHLCEGSNKDDEGDYRPGLKAVAELGVASPLRDAGLYKAEIRALSREMGLPTWDKQSFACLASRFPYGERITREKLALVDKAEQWLLDQGFRQLRVRIHDDVRHDYLARIEVAPGELPRLFELRDEAAAALRQMGFTYVTMDLMGYRTGSMNEALHAGEGA